MSKDWEEQFDKKFTEDLLPLVGVKYTNQFMTRQKVKDFIRDLLKSERKALLENIKDEFKNAMVKSFDLPNGNTALLEVSIDFLKQLEGEAEND